MEEYHDAMQSHPNQVSFMDTSFVAPPIGGGTQDTSHNAGDDDDDETYSDQMPPPPNTPDQRHEEQEQQDGNDAFPEDGPWSVDWTSMAAENLKTALEGYKEHAKALFGAMTTFVHESNAVHAEWQAIHQAELAESQRLDEVEPDVYQATSFGGSVYGSENYGNGDEICNERSA